MMKCLNMPVTLPMVIGLFIRSMNPFLYGS